MRLLVGLSLAVVVGCGDSDKVNRLPDAPPPPDADVDASTMGTVSLSILEGTSPRVGVRVLFQNADSSVVSETTTGTDGKASAVMAPGGFVTAFDAFAIPQGVQRTDIRTFAGVKPGDELRLYERPLEATPIDVTVILPTDAQAAEYRVSTNCLFGAPIFAGGGSGGSPMGTLQLSGCGATSNLLVETFDGLLNPLGFFYKPTVTLENNGMIDLTAETYTAIPDATFAYSNVPESYGTVVIFGLRSTSLGPIYNFTTSGSLASGAGTATAKVPTIADSTAATLSTFYGSGFTQQIVVEWGPPSTSYALDAGALLLPEFDGVATLDAAAHAVTWTQSGGGVQPDYVHVRAFLNRDLGGTNLNWRWEIVAPGTTEAVFPVLPDASQYNPIAGDFGAFDVRTVKVPGGYDAVRANALAAEGLQDLAVGASGKASFALLVEPSAFTGRSR